MLANLFQELACSLKTGLVDERYTWDVFGHLIQLYWRNMEGALMALRNARSRYSLWGDFQAMANRMAVLDRKYSPRPTPVSVRSSYVFAYGSLINPASVRKSLPLLESSAVRAAWLEGYQRSWSFVATASHGTPKTSVRLAFLNLEPNSSGYVTGVLVPVSPNDLGALDRRETGYNRVDITARIRPESDGQVFTYISEPCVTDHNVLVAAEYVEIIKAGLRYWGQGFADSFWASTRANDLEVFVGNYRFESEIQNRAAGR